MRSLPRLSAAALAVALAVVAAAPLAEPAAAAGRSWQRPVAGDVLRPFSVGPDRYAAGQHRGVDLAARPGAAVRAACGGRVTFAGRVPRGGRTLSVRCGPLTATYQHLGSVFVQRGQGVVAGMPIAAAGSDGRPAPHVHLGARVAATGAYVDPLTLLRAAPRVVPPLPPPARRPAVRRPRPAGPRAPWPRAAPVAAPVAARRPLPAARGIDARRPPWPVWLGLGLVALGVPVGGLVRVRARRDRAARAAVAAPRAAS